MFNLSLLSKSSLLLVPVPPPHFLSLQPLQQPPLSLSLNTPLKCHATPNSNNTTPLDIDLVKTREGIFVPKQTKVVILWDLDNKPPRGPPYEAAISLKNLATSFGDLTEISAYANRHAFTHLPSWVIQQRRERRRMDVLERKGLVGPAKEYICTVCGRKCRTNLDLKKHFKQLHERERQKRLTRMKQLKGKKRLRFKERFMDKDEKYEEGVRGLMVPKVGYGLGKELRRAGVFVKTVDDKPQAADWALKRQMVHSMSRGIDWLVLVSDDSDFGEMLRRAKEGGLRTVVVGDRNGVLGKVADLWVPWSGVERGEIGVEDLVVKRGGGGREWGDEEGVVREEGLFSISEGDDDEGFDVGMELDKIVDEVVGGDKGGRGRLLAFSEGEEDEEWIDDGDYYDEFDFEDELEDGDM